MPDFPTKILEIDQDTALWGPYTFTFPIASSATANDGIIPFGDTLASVVMEVYDGTVERGDVLTDETALHSTDYTMIDANYSPVVGDSTVKLKFIYPTDSTYTGQKATLVFVVTLTSGGTKAFYYHFVKVRG